MSAEVMADKNHELARFLAKRIGNRNLNPSYVWASCWLFYAICGRLGLSVPCLAWLSECRPEMAAEISESLNIVS